MESLSNLIRVHIPNYFQNLPVPNSFSGLFRLKVSEWIQLAPLMALIAVPSYYLHRKYLAITDANSQNRIKSKAKVNLNINKSTSKIVDTVDIEDVKKCEPTGQKVMCRCWRSKKFPFCDGTHNAHNDATGDNVGPLIIKY